MKTAVTQFRENRRLKHDSVDDAPPSPKVDPTVLKHRLDERHRLKEKRANDAAQAAEEEREAEQKVRKKLYTELCHNLMRKKVEAPALIKFTPPEELEVDTRKQWRPEDWDRIKKRDDAAREKKDAAKQAQEAARLAKEERQRKIAEKTAKKFKNAKRDPERLMQPTAAMRARKEAEDDEPKGPVNSVFMIPHRATPAWMV
jgi:hypothetical protein